MSVLIVVAHPDDEVLGCGGTANALAEAGHQVRACIVSSEAEARSVQPRLGSVADEAREAHKLLGIEPAILGPFPNLALNAVPHIELVQFIEAAILATGARTIFTHHPEDLNDDHRQTSRACEAAIRVSQRRKEGASTVRGFHYIEVLSATDWSLSANSFRPTTFFEIGELGVQRKWEALGAFTGAQRDYPHPRSVEALTALATLRGAQAGLRFAEAFETRFMLLDEGL